MAIGFKALTVGKGDEIREGPNFGFILWRDVPAVAGASGGDIWAERMGLDCAFLSAV